MYYFKYFQWTNIARTSPPNLNNLWGNLKATFEALALEVKVVICM